MKTVKPHNDQNAIKVVAFVVEFAENFDEKFIISFIEEYETTLKKELPRKQILDGVFFQMSPTENSISNKKFAGVTFDILKPDGQPLWAISVRNNLLIITCGEYTKWKEVSQKAFDFFDTVSASFNDSIVKSAGLEFVDEFLILEPSYDWTKDLFNSDATYLPRNIQNLKKFWHSHHGFFVEYDDDNVLNNVNINSLLEDQAHKVLITTVHKSFLKQPVLFSEFYKDFESLLERIHIMNKNVMADVLSKEICKEIQLEVPQ